LSFVDADSLYAEAHRPVASRLRVEPSADAERAELPAVSWRRRAPMAPAVTVVISSLTGSVVVVAALLLFNAHPRAPSVDADRREPSAATRASVSFAFLPASSQPVAAGSARPPTAPSSDTYAITDPRRVPGAATAQPLDAATNPADLPFGFGFLTVAYARPAEVYLQGKRVGATNQRLKVRCGRSFVRLASSATGPYPEWLTAGETTAIPCQGATQIELGQIR
jgi:hypothetical protein